MIRAIFILLLTASCALGAVRLTGNHYFAKRALETFQLAAKSPEELRNELMEAYLRAGFYAVSIDLDTSGDTTIVINEGVRFRSDGLALHGLDSGVVNQRILDKDVQPVTFEYLENLLKRVVEAYAEAGYPFCQAEIKQISAGEGRLELEFGITTGPPATFGRVEFSGLVTSKPERLRGRLKMKEGGAYRESEVRQSKRTLSRLEFTRPSREPVVLHDTRRNAADVIFAMRDERNLTIDGLFFLDSDSKLGGSADLGLLNIFGTGERVSLHWSRIDKDSRELGLGAQMPDAGGYPVDLQFEARQSDQDSAFISAKLRAGAMYHFSEDWQVGAGISWEKITPEEGHRSPSARIAGVSLNTRFENRDEAKTTRRGVLMQTEFGSLYRKSFNDGGDVSTGYSTLINARLELWRPVSNRWVVYQRLTPYQIRSDFQPLPVEQLIEIGGPKSVRGFRERSFRSDIGIVSATEFRYLFEEGFLARIFCDNAYVGTEAGTRTLTGFGLGMELVTTLGRFRIDFSLGEEKQLGGMLVHFGFETGI